MRQFIDALRECLDMDPLYDSGLPKTAAERFYRRFPDDGFDSNGNRTVSPTKYR